MEAKEKEYEYEIDKRYAGEQASKRRQYRNIIYKVEILIYATLGAVIFVTIFAIGFFPQDISAIGLITIIYSGVIFVGISLYRNKKVKELLKH